MKSSNDYVPRDDEFREPADRSLSTDSECRRKRAADGPYFQFPISALAYGPDEIRRLCAIISWCAITTGTKLMEKMNPAEIQQRIEEANQTAAETGFRSGKSLHVVLAVGLHRLNSTLSNFNGGVEIYQSLDGFINEMAQRHGTAPLTRLRTDFVGEALRGDGMKYRELSVLAAIFSCIGNKRYARVTREQIAARALGYKSPRLLEGTEGEELLKERKDGAVPLTANQVRHTLEALEWRGLFARCVLCRRHAYFSHRLNHNRLRQVLRERKLRKCREMSDNRRGDRELSMLVKFSKVQALKGELSEERLTRALNLQSQSPFAHR